MPPLVGQRGSATKGLKLRIQEAWCLPSVTTTTPSGGRALRRGPDGPAQPPNPASNAATRHRVLSPAYAPHTAIAEQTANPPWGQGPTSGKRFQKPLSS